MDHERWKTGYVTPDLDKAKGDLYGANDKAWKLSWELYDVWKLLEGSGWRDEQTAAYERITDAQVKAIHDLHRGAKKFAERLEAVRRKHFK